MHLLKTFWTKWKKFGHTIADFQSRLILTIVYVVVIIPAGLVFKSTKNPLLTKGKVKWQQFQLNASNLTHVKNQF